MTGTCGWTLLCTCTIIVAKNPLGLACTNWSLGSYLVCPLNPNWVSSLQAPQHTEYTQTTGLTLHQAKEIVRDGLSATRVKQCTNGHPVEWRPYEVNQHVWLKRPKKWKFGPKWLGPHRVSSETGCTLIVHHNHLKPYYMPTGQGRTICSEAEAVNAYLYLKANILI